MPTRRRLVPTTAFMRAVAVAACSFLLAIGTHRIEPAVLGVPFLIYAAWAWARHRPVDNALPPPDVLSSSRSVREGDTVRLALRDDGLGLIHTVHWPVVASAHAQPRWACAVDISHPHRVRPSAPAEHAAKVPSHEAKAPSLEAKAPSPKSTVAPITFTMRRWGRYDIGPGRILLADPLASHRWTGTLPAVEFTVIPISPILDASTQVTRPIGMTGRHTSSARGDGSALADVRPFQHGDRLRRINWRVTSRTGTLHTNSTLTDRDTDVLIVADTLADLRPAGPGVRVTALEAEESSLDMTVRAAAAIAHHYLGVGDRVALHDLGHRIGHIPRGSGPRHVRRVFDSLSRARRELVTRDRFQPLLSLRGGTLVFVCSPLLLPPVVNEIVRLVHLGGEVVVIDTLPSSLGSLHHLGRDGNQSLDRPPGPSLIQISGVTAGQTLTQSLDRALDSSPDAPLRPNRGPLSDPHFWQEAWVLRRLEREQTVDHLRRLGVPVTPWTGPSALTQVLQAMSRARSAPRLRRSR
ncbi:DUF58 domain-containing protein [Devriesea agamarum]|uniref:DUF58 domain-containing protein n=1 Tax=Devriesea agamarum TaxID=472569 RepID=UPI00071DA025|nr:DUF58 domain-containing protein [Devriesea agamarum]